MSTTRVRPIKSKDRTNGNVARNDKTTDWQFINTSESKSVRDPELRRTVRVNAMRNYRKRQKEIRDDCRELPSLGKQSQPCPSSTGSRNPSMSSCGKEINGISWLAEDDYHWPTEWDRLLNEAQMACISLSPLSILEELPQPQHVSRDNDSAGSETTCVTAALTISPHLPNGCSNEDPFDSYPIKGGSQMSELLYHCKLCSFGLLIRLPLTTVYVLSASVLPLIVTGSSYSRQRYGS